MSYVESAAGLLIPQVPMNRCRLCGAEFPVGNDRDFVGHVEDCYREHENELHAEMVERNKPMWDLDEERYQWLKSGRNP